MLSSPGTRPGEAPFGQHAFTASDTNLSSLHCGPSLSPCHPITRLNVQLPHSIDQLGINQRQYVGIVDPIADVMLPNVAAGNGRRDRIAARAHRRNAHTKIHRSEISSLSRRKLYPFVGSIGGADLDIQMVPKYKADDGMLHRFSESFA